MSTQNHLEPTHTLKRSLPKALVTSIACFLFVALVALLFNTNITELIRENPVPTIAALIAFPFLYIPITDYRANKREQQTKTAE